MIKLAGTLAAAGAVLVLAACGSPTKPGVATANGKRTGAAASASASTDPQTRGRQFAACMRQHGVNMPDPAPGSKDIQVPAVDKNADSTAIQACQHFLGNKMGGRPSAAQLAKLRDYSKCMRSHGIPDFPDPDPNTGALTLNKQSGSDLNQNNPRFQQAEQTCSSTMKGQ